MPHYHNRTIRTTQVGFWPIAFHSVNILKVFRYLKALVKTHSSDFGILLETEPKRYLLQPVRRSPKSAYFRIKLDNLCVIVLVEDDSLGETFFKSFPEKGIISN